MKKSLVSVLVASISLFSFQNAHAACELGPVIFKNTLYGTAIGAGVGGLFLVANQSSNNIAPTIATSALIGTGIGIVAGLVEISMSQCAIPLKKRSDFEAYRFEFKPLLSLPQLAGGLTVQIDLPALVN